MALEVDKVSVPAADDMHESCVAPGLAAVAERFGVHLRAADRFRFDVLGGGGVGDDGPARREP